MNGILNFQLSLNWPRVINHPCIRKTPVSMTSSFGRLPKMNMKLSSSSGSSLTPENQSTNSFYTSGANALLAKRKLSFWVI